LNLPKEHAINTSTPQFDDLLALLSSNELASLPVEIGRGIEKEGLRTTGNAELALTPHPEALGSALTNSWLTTDFSEALLEFITPVHHSAHSMLEQLTQLHAYAAQHIGDEMIWSASMPCILPTDSQIPLARYGSSNVATMKTAYRRGLGHRYGRAMQTVAGIHYNFSLPKAYWRAELELNGARVTDSEKLQHYIDTRYLGLIRNFRRRYWLLIYLFGAAPCIDKSFIQNRPHNLNQLSSNDYYLPYGTSLRMGDLGYQSDAQKSLFVCYNELSTYIETLHRAMHTPYSAYESIGLNESGDYQQLSTALLQIENEFYSPIRPKRVASGSETPLAALANHGIEYIEIRCIDINPMLSVGIDTETIDFIDVFLLTCLIKDSPLCDQQEFDLIAKNQSLVVEKGRKPDLNVYCGKQLINMRQCAKQFLADIARVAETLDKNTGNNCYSHAVAQQIAKIDNPELTPSAVILQNMQDQQLSHIEYSLQQTQRHMASFRAQPLSAALNAELAASAKKSLQLQRQIEDADSISFAAYLQNYYANQPIFSAAKMQ